MNHVSTALTFKATFVGRVTAIESYPSYVSTVTGTRITLSNTDTGFGGYQYVLIPLGSPVPQLGDIVTVTSTWQYDAQQDAHADGEDATVVSLSTDDGESL